jgi:hypothetical protein
MKKTKIMISTSDDTGRRRRTVYVGPDYDRQYADIVFLLVQVWCREDLTIASTLFLFLRRKCRSCGDIESFSCFDGVFSEVFEIAPRKDVTDFSRICLREICQ